jgi:tyrosine phenol-lyase
LHSENIKFMIARFRDLLEMREEPGTYFIPRPYRNAAVRLRRCRMDDFDKRLNLLETAGLNVFLFPSAEIPGCDLLTDSGTTTMTMEQWSQILLGDEAYGSNEGYFELLDQVERTFGPAWRQATPRRPTVFVFHQGRAAEHALFTVLRRELWSHEDAPPAGRLPDALGRDLAARISRRAETLVTRAADRRRPYFIIPSNSHFDTTEANIEANNIVPLNLPCREHLEGDSEYGFRGNMDLEELETLVEHLGDRVPLVYMTITNNTGGGQPVSMANIRGAHEIASHHGVPFFLDACRFAENAWFIKQREAGFGAKSIREIVHEMFSHSEGFHISLKKDGLANMGGMLALRDGTLFTEKYPDFADKVTNHQILTEGHPTYGGLAGRDLKAIAEGLRTVVREEYLQHRVGQVERFGGKLVEYDIPVMQPPGGHAIYIDMDRFFEGTETADLDLKGISFTALMLLAGHRLAELGVYAFGRSQNGNEVPPDPRVNNVRAAVPRLVYEDRDLLAVCEAVRILHENADRIPGVEVEYGRELPLRHFKSRFKFQAG